MKEELTTEQRYLKAQEKVKDIKSFYGNLTAYLIVIPFLAFINYQTMGWEYMWFLWPALGWGIGLLFHAIRVFSVNPFFGKEWEERKIREFMSNDKAIKNKWE